MKEKVCLKVGLVGCGQRGAGFGMTDGSIGLLGNILNNAENVQVTAVCDKFQDRVDFAAGKVVAAGQKEPLKTTDFNEVIAAKVDAIIVSTSWSNHVVVALVAMEAGIAVGIEVGGTHDIEDCWKLVDCYERTKTPFMFLENCCFGKEEMLATSLVRNGKLGAVSYCQGYYCHDLREEITSQGLYANHYRLKEYTEHNCENYPTHELGPIAKILNINTGNKFTKLVSMSSKAQGLNQYINDNMDRLSPLKDRVFAQGDVVTTMIECENGETIFLKLDTTLPRLYERGLTVSGTKGFYCQTTESVILDDGKYNHEMDPYKKAFFNQDDYKEYLPDEWREITEEQMKAGHGGIDFIMLKRFFYCVQNKLPMPIDVYDACSWMVVTALSAQSIAGGNIPVEFPDFTRGQYKTRKTVDVLDLPKVEG